MIERINTFFKERDILCENLKQILSDKEIPLEDRWNIFVTSNDILPIQIYGDGFIDILDEDKCLYNDFYIERYQTVKYQDIYERIIEDPDYNELSNSDQWRETVLASGYSGFVYDW